MNEYYNNDNNTQDTPNGYGSYSYTPQPPVKRRYGAGIVILSVILAAVIGASAGVTGVLSYLKFKDGGADSSASSGKSSSAIESKNVNITVSETADSIAQAVYEKAGQSVVGIRTTTSVMNFFGGSQEATGSGSGVVYSEDGYIITNYHVIENAVKSTSESKIEVFIGSLDSKSYEASVVGYVISSDLAVLKISGKNLKPIEIADSSKLKVGQPAVTIGAPGGLEFMGSVTYGVISGLDRVVSASSNLSLIQTDAAINPGNSGGALLDINGKLIGINSSKIVAEEYEGMGFAIPSNKVSEVVKGIISRENEPDPYIGISISEKYTAQMLAYYGYPAGAVVLSVYEDSPAAEAGIRRGDIITEFNGKEISDYSLYYDYLKECTPGQKVKIKYYR
ncbi:MAG: trypsin-like peptidase domain-containing protein, partial [Clostridia bacterium]|nr:trypsin-like peptidase domain-containing protein [Clostridia bacterium]